MKAAKDILELLVDLVRFTVRAIADGKPERVEEIIPPTLRTQLSRARADAELDEQLARRRAMVEAGSSGSGHQ